MQQRAFYNLLTQVKWVTRDLRLGAGILLSLLPSLCLALGLSDLQHSSFLGEPLKANIKLLNVPPNISEQAIKVRQINRQDAEQLGVELRSNWQPVELKLKTTNRSFSIDLSTRTPVKEPYFHMLVEVTWPNGKIYKEYNIFLDPPGLAKTPNN